MRGTRLFELGAEPPRDLGLGPVRLRLLGLDDLDPDFAAVMESEAALQGLFDPGDTWPTGLTLRQNTLDLAWHEKEFQRGTSFAWGIWGQGYLGSAYLYPDPTGRAVAHAVHWVRSGVTDPGLRAAIAAAWGDWVRGLPLASVRVGPD